MALWTSRLAWCRSWVGLLMAKDAAGVGSVVERDKAVGIDRETEPNRKKDNTSLSHGI